MTFECEVTIPKAKVTWLKDGMPIEEGPKYHIVEEGPIRKLVIKDVSSEDEADYSCVVKEEKTQAELAVAGKLNKKFKT